jgi:prepilin-type N-terminal cleavage/methylation domain-containing protein
MNLFKKHVLSGFTLIELLVVLGVLSVLAAVLLILVDPAEQLARARDTGRKSSVGQLGRSLQAYYTQNGAAFPLSSSDDLWKTALTASELKSFPKAPSGADLVAADCTSLTNPTGDATDNFCYRSDGTNAVVFLKVESKADKIKAGNGTLCASIAWYVWSSYEGKSGYYCNATPPSIGAITGGLL